MSNNPNVGKVFNLTGGGGGGGTLKLDSIAITKAPTKKTYKSGESFDATGMVVTATYGYGITSDVTGYTVTPVVLTDGVTEVTITYTEGRVTKTASTPVTVEKVLVSIGVTTPPTKTVYDYLEKFQPAGMVVTATFSDGSTAPATGYSYSDTAFSTLGQQTVSLEYTYEGVTKSTSLNVTVNAIEVAVPTQKNIPSYDGTSKSPVWDGFDSVKMAVDGDMSGVNAKDNYSVTFTLSYGYVFPDGTGSATVQWKIDRAVIAAVPAQIDVPAADGTPKSPTWDSYDPTKMTIGGDRFGTDAGDYTANFTPTPNYKWWDGSTEAKDAPWTIASILVTIPTQKNIPTYDGSKKSPEWNNFDTEHCTVQVTSVADAGEYEATFTLLAGMWEDGGTAPKKIQWKINRASIAAVPAQTDIPSYDGNPKTPTWNNAYESTKMVLDVESKILAGTDYLASFTPKPNYQWWDGTIEAKTVTWTINRVSIETIPSQSAEMTYTGSEQTVSLKDYDSAKLILGGTIKGINAGKYSANVTPTANYQWSDGTQDARTVVWTIAKAAENVSVSPASAVLNAENPMVVLRVGLEGDGVITAESSDESVAVVDVSGGFPVVYAVANASGSATITVRVGEGTNHLAAEATMEVTASFALIYGVEWNDSTSSKLSRTDAAAMFTDPVPAVNNGTGSSPFDDIMPWAGIKRVTDSAAGELVEIPKFWYRLTQNDGALKVQISPDYVAGYSVSPAHMDRGDGTGERNVVYIGRYHCVSGYKSATAKRPLVSITRATARTNIHKLGATIWQCDFAMWFTIWLLYLVEFADWDSQACIGAGGGPGTSVGNMGYTDVMKYHTGTSLATRNTVGLGTQYRWIEGLWDNAYDWVDGCYWSTGGYKLNVILNPSSFNDSTGGNVVPSPDNVNHFGYPSEFSVTNTPGFPIFYPTNFDSSGTSSGFADYWSTGSSSSVCIITGGYYQATYRKASGLFTFWNHANTASDTISSRLMKLP